MNIKEIKKVLNLKDRKKEQKNLILQYIQPGLLGLMDGSISTLAPLFAAAFATHSTRIALLVGLSSAVGASISMGFAEALSDTGVHTGRGYPFQRGFITGFMTFVGGVLHAVPFFISNFIQAITIAFVVVGLELVAISYVRYKYLQMKFVISAIQVVFGSFLVLAAGIVIGSS